MMRMVRCLPMKTVNSALVLAAAALLQACQVVAPDKRPDFDAVQLKRTACHGTCPVYAVEVLPDGSVHYKGEEHVQVAGERHAKMNATRLSLLSLAIEHADFQDMRASYGKGTEGCASYRTDMSTLEITVRRGGIGKSVSYYLGCDGPEAPLKKLAWLGQTIDEMANTRQFTGR